MFRDSSIEPDTDSIYTLPVDLFGVIGHFTRIKWPKEKWACDFHENAMTLSFQLQVTEEFF